MLVLGDKPTNGRLEAMLEKLNARLTEQANATLDLFYVEWADWQTQYNIQLLSGDDNIDLITTATDWLFAWENAEKGAFLPLSEEMLQEHAPKTWAQVDANGNWDLTKLPTARSTSSPRTTSPSTRTTASSTAVTGPRRPASRTARSRSSRTSPPTSGGSRRTRRTPTRGTSPEPTRPR